MFAQGVLHEFRIDQQATKILTIMNLEKVRLAFQRQGFTLTSRIRKSEFDEFLNSLMTGEAYDEMVAGQIWKEASKGSQTTTVDDICGTIIEAQNIIHNKLAEFNEQISQLEQNKKEAEAAFGKQSIKVAQIEENLQLILEEKAEFDEDLRLLTIPFGITSGGNRANISRASRREDPSEDGSRMDANRSNTKLSDNDELAWLFYLTVVFGVIQIILIYGKYDYLNLIVLTCLLFIYLLNHFDPVYIKMTFTLLIVSEVLDVIWLFMYAGQNWSPPSVGNHSSSEGAYLKFIVFFTIVVVIMKIPLGYLLYQYRNASGDRKYNLELGQVKIVLTPNKSNPITRGLNHSIGLNSG